MSTSFDAKPAFLDDPRFQNLNLTLLDYAGHFQQWKSEALNMSIFFNPDRSIKSINIDFIPEKITSANYAFPFKSFMPDCVKERNEKGGEFKLKTLLQFMHLGKWEQHWVNEQGAMILCYLDDAMQLDKYSTITPYEGFSEDCTYRSNGVLVTKRRRYPSDFLIEVENYFDSGQLKSQYQSTKDEIYVGTLRIFNEQGFCTYERDYEELPHFNIAFEKLKNIVAENGKALKDCDFGLYWLVNDGEGRKFLEINTQTGYAKNLAQQELTKEANAVAPPDQEFQGFIKELLGEDKVYIDDSELICGSGSYFDVLEKLKTLAGSHIQWQDVVIAESARPDKWAATISVNDVTEQFELNANTDWFDTAFIKHINLCLRRSRSRSTFYLVRDEQWGQEMGFIFINDAMAGCLNQKIKSYRPLYYWGMIDNLVDVSTDNITA